jgi:uncharacterized alpha-E superfamily protein
MSPVHERIEHLRIDVAAIVDLQILDEDVPHRLRRGLMIGRQIARALAGAHDLEST